MQIDTSLVLKISAIAILFFAASLMLKARLIAASLFTLSVAGYLGCQIVHGVQLNVWVVRAIHVGCFSVPVTFLVLTESLFEDDFRWRWRYFLYFVFIELFNFFFVGYLRIYASEAQLRFGDSLTLLRALPQIVSLAFLATALGKILFKRKADLVESRRKFRLKFTGIVAVYMVVILLMEIAYHGGESPAWLDLLNSAGLLATAWYLAAKVLHVKEGTLGEPEHSRPKATVAIDNVLLGKLKHAIEVDKIYAEESLSIRRLAEHLDTQEYLLRKLINQALGYKNFNDYLNEIRIGEACRVLQNRDQSTIPIIRIAMDLGFGSLAPFNRAFKERQGMTPTEFRRQADSLLSVQKNG